MGDAAAIRPPVLTDEALVQVQEGSNTSLLVRLHCQEHLHKRLDFPWRLSDHDYGDCVSRSSSRWCATRLHPCTRCPRIGRVPCMGPAVP